MSREAMQMALEALEDYVEEYGPHEKDSGAAYAITALRQALETKQAMNDEDIIRVACEAGWDVQNLDDGFGKRLKRFAKALKNIR